MNLVVPLVQKLKLKLITVGHVQTIVEFELCLWLLLVLQSRELQSVMVPE